jgi:hypothetical protein
LIAFKAGQVGSGIVDEFQTRIIPVEVLGPVDHPGGDVEADDVLEVLGQGLGEAAQAAAEVEGPSPGQVDL